MDKKKSNVDNEILNHVKKVEEEVLNEEENKKKDENKNEGEKYENKVFSLNVKIFSVFVIFMIIVLSVYFLLGSVSFSKSKEDNIFHYGLYTFKYDKDSKLYSLDYQKNYVNSSIIYKIDFSYLPQNLTDIKVYGFFSGLNNNFSMSFQPDMNKSNLAHVNVALLDAARKFIGLYKQYPKVFCTNSSLDPNCPKKSVVCDGNTSALVFYESNNTGIVFKNNCVEFYGSNDDFERMENLFFYYILGIVKFEKVK